MANALVEQIFKGACVVNTKRVICLLCVFISTCFVVMFAGLIPDSKIATLQGLVSLEALPIGSKVTGFDRERNEFCETSIEQKESKDVQEVYLITTEKGVVGASGDQLFYEVTANDFIKAEELTIDSILQTKEYKESLCLNVEKKNVSIQVYELALRESHLFFAGEQQVLVHNNPAFVLTFPWVTKAIVALAGFCVSLVCLYNEKPTGALWQLEKVEEKVKNDMCDLCSRHYNGKAKSSPENYKEYATIPANPSKGGIALNPDLCQNLVTYPLRYGSLYPIAFMTNTGSVACVIFVPKFSYWASDGTGYWNMIELGKEIIPRSDPFVKAFVDAEDKMQLESLRVAVKKWPSSLVNKLFKSKVTIKEKWLLRNQNSSLDQVIYGNTFGIDAIYHMAGKNFAPSLVLQTINYGCKGMLCNADYLLCFDAKQGVAVLYEKKTKKIIDVGYYSKDLGSLSETKEASNDRKQEHNSNVGTDSPGGLDPKDPKDKKNEKNKKNQITIYEKNVQHIFREAEIHFKIDTLENRKLLIETANNEENLLGTSKYNSQWYSKLTENGKQIWVEVRNGEIRNGGINDAPKTFNSETGLSYQIKS